MAQDNGEKSGGNKKKLLLGLVVFVLLAGGGGAFYFLSGDKGFERDIKLKDANPVKLQAIYVSLPQPFVFNVTGDDLQRLVQVTVKLLVRGVENENLAKQNLPMIEQSLLTTFGAATLKQLSNPQGQIELRKQALTNVQEAMKKIVDVPVVDRVVFTGFVMQ